MIKKILVAPDSFKGTITASQVCNIISKAIIEVMPQVEVVSMPLSDGGEGLVEAMLTVSNGYLRTITVHDPYMRLVEASYAIIDEEIAVIEMSAAAGLPLLNANELDPLHTTTFGVGELIKDALDQNCSRIILGLGGSATNDGGIGAASVLGYKFCDENGEVSLNGSGLGKITSVDISNIDSRLHKVQIKIACDVENTLYGTNGAAYVYAPQKGASPEDVKILDDNLMNYASVIHRQFGINFQDISGSGAAGGLSVPFLLLKNAEITSGLMLILDYLNFCEVAEKCDLVITGEGNTDKQSSMGKVLSGVAQLSQTVGTPAISISGGLSDGYSDLYKKGMKACFSTCRQVMTLEQALSTAEHSLYYATIDLVRLIKVLSQ